MVNRNYQRGYYIENKVVNEFRKKGYLAFRSAGSHSMADVVAITKDYIYLIQLKRVKNPGYSFKREAEKFKKIKTFHKNIRKELWIYRDFERRNKKWEKIRIGTQ